MASQAAEVLKLVDPADLPELMGEAQPEEPKQKRKSAADELLELVNASGLILFKDEYGAAFAAIPVDGRQEVHSLRSKAFRLWLNRLFYQAKDRALQSDAMRMVRDTLEAEAVFDGPTKVLALRVASGPDGAFYYDLCGDGWQAVRIDDTGYTVKSPPILFRRRANSGPQVLPKKAGAGLWCFLDFVNVKNQADQNLLMVYLCLCCVPDIPRLVLVVHGEKGAGKSFLLRLVRRIVDPAPLELQIVPNDKSELALTLASGSFVAFDNVDHLQAWQSDSICCAATGGGVKKRELYSDDDEIILKFRHSVGICGISNVATRPDLMDRSILVELGRLDESERRTEAEIEREFERVRPGILHDLFTTITKARTILPTIKDRNLPRMADSARWGAAIAEALGIGADRFFDDLAANGATANDETIRSNPVALAMYTFMQRRDEWRGTAGELLAELKRVAFDESIDTTSRSWPSSAVALSKRIRVVRSNLIAAGVQVELYQSTCSAHRRMIALKNTSPQRVEKNTSDASELPKPSIFAAFGSDS